jgi:hypothetical protein
MPLAKSSPRQAGSTPSPCSGLEQTAAYALAQDAARQAQQRSGGSSGSQAQARFVPVRSIAGSNGAIGGALAPIVLGLRGPAAVRQNR